MQFEGKVFRKMGENAAYITDKNPKQGSKLRLKGLS